MIDWAGLSASERRVLMTVAAMHREFGPDARFTTLAIEHVDGRACRGELGILTLFEMLEYGPGANGVDGYRLSDVGHAALPYGEDRRALDEHREEAEQKLREEQ